MLAWINLGYLGVLLASLTVAPTVGCGDSSSAGGSPGSGGSDPTGTGGSGGSTAVGLGGDAGVGGGTGGAGGSAPEEPFTEVTPGTAACFSFATGEATPNNPCDGDIYFLTGVNVDLSAEGSGGFCLQAGTFTTLDSVPSDYAACAFETYVEGADGLDNTGYIVADAAALHHYRMQIISNELPTIQFRFDMID